LKNERARQNASRSQQQHQQQQQQQQQQQHVTSCPDTLPAAQSPRIAADTGRQQQRNAQAELWLASISVAAAQFGCSLTGACMPMTTCCWHAAYTQEQCALLTTTQQKAALLKLHR
jgi:hypothetical protein